MNNTEKPKDVPIDEEIQIMENTAFVERLIKGWGSLSARKKISYLYIASFAIGMSIFHLYTAIFGTLPAWQHRAVHVCLGLLLIFALYPLNKKKGFTFFDFIPLIMSMIVFAYVLIDYPGQELRIGDPNTMDVIIASMLIFLVIESTRRTNGLPMALIAIFFLVYIFTGPYFPGLLGHQGFRYVKMVDQMFNGTVGVFSTPIYVSSTVLILYVIWGTFLVKSGAGQFFTDLALAITGRFRGGPALGAVASSAMVGSITGNGSANVAITGAFTIPLMKKIKYQPEFAGAVEAVASQGGQIMPPIMGAAVFIMAEFVNIPYIKIAGAAAIPATAYFLIAGFIIYIQARKRGLGGLPKEQLPQVWEILKKGFYFVLPIVFIVYMLVIGNSPMKAGFWAIILTIGLSYIRKETRLGFVDILACLEKGARSGLSVMSACASAGIIVGAISLTGLGVRFTRFAIETSGDNLLVLLILIMFSSLILGMGMPTASAYIILGVLGAPVLVKMGVNIIAAHLFVFYFGVISGLTPPVAITAYTAAGIAGSNPTKTALLATKIGIGGFLLPFMFVYNPALVLQEATALQIISCTVTALIGCFSFAIFVQNYFLTKTNLFERISFLASAILLIDGSLITDISGACLFLIAMLSQIRRQSKQNLLTEVNSN